MKDQNESREQLSDELAELRQQMAALEGVDLERRRAEEALREREARLLEAQEVASLGFYVLDFSTGRFTTSSVLDRIFGIPADYERSVDGWANLVHPDERQEMLDYFLKEVVKEKHPFDREYRIVRYGDKRVWWVHGLGRLQLDEDGQPVSMLGTIQDITDRKRAEEALQQAHDELEQRVEERTAELRASTERYALAVRGAGVGIWDWDIRTGKVYYSPRWKMLFGYDENDTGDGVEDWARLLHPDERDWILKFQDDFLAGTSPTVTVEYRLRHKDGSYRWIVAHGLVVRDEQGRACRLVGSHGDITDRRRAEDALRASEEKYRGVVDACPDAVVMSDFNGQVLFASRQTRRLLGLADSDELAGRNVIDDVIENDRKRLAENMSNLVEVGVRRNTEYTSIRRGGTTVPVEASSVVIRDAAGQPKAVMAVIRDITERKQAEEATRQLLRTVDEERGRLQAIIDSLPIGLWIADATGKMTLINDSAHTIWGGAAPYAENTQDYGVYKAWWADTGKLIVAEDMPMARSLRGETCKEKVIDFERFDGTIGTQLVSSTPIKTADGTVIGSVAVVQDITERRRAHEALLRERRTLKHMLEASDHERQLIAYDIHDGLAQELAGAMMQFQIYDQFKDRNPDEAKKAYDGGVTLLRQSHVEARRLISGVRPPILDESGVVAAIVHLVYDPAFEQGPKIDFRNRVKFKRLDPVLENVIYRIVQEGLSNARNHSKSKEILVSLKQRGERLRIEIRDWGVGFDPKTVQENRFGLEGIRERARLLGGKCNIKSKPGEGSSIVVELPVVEREADK